MVAIRDLLTTLEARRQIRAVFALDHIADVLVCGQSTAVECAKHTESLLWRSACHCIRAIKTVRKDRAKSPRKSRE
jgi:hypothetical protein